MCLLLDLRSQVLVGIMAEQSTNQTIVSNIASITIFGGAASSSEDERVGSDTSEVRSSISFFLFISNSFTYFSSRVVLPALAMKTHIWPLTFLMNCEKVIFSVEPMSVILGGTN